MKAIYPFSVRHFKNSSFWLLAIAAGLVTVNMTLLAKSGDTAHLGMSALFWLAVGSLLWEKRHSLSLKSEFVPTIIGTIFIAWVLFNSFPIPERGDPFLRISPFIVALGMSLIAAGFGGLKQFRQEITILFFLGVPSIIISSLIDISPFTAKASALLLWYLGFDVSVSGVYVNLPTGSVKVYEACAGLDLICYMLGLAVICLVMFPTKREYNIVVAPTAIVLAFVVNGIRVALMAVLSAYDKREAFIYMHEGDGSLVFGMIAVLIFGSFYMLLLRQSESKSK